MNISLDHNSLYKIVSYLPLRNYKEENGKFIVELGAEKHFKKIQLDRISFQIFQEFLQPQSPKLICQKYSLPEEVILKFIENLLSEGILCSSSSIPDHFDRYDRHLQYYALNKLDPLTAQQKLSELTITLIGVGGIGNWVGLNLIGLGLKKIKLVDPDTIEESNLARQVLFYERDIGNEKVTVARDALFNRNSATEIECFKEQITEDNIAPLVNGTDFVILSADRPFFHIQKWVNKACVAQKVPFLNVGYTGERGVLGSLVIPSQTACWQCNRSQLNDSTEMNPNAQKIYEHFRAPSFSCLNSLISSMASYEIVKYFLGIGECVSINHLLFIDPLTFAIERISLTKNPLCSICKHC